ncbi:MAG TPA: serine hydrolase domain-containing protein [Vicinamibacterales bacterium]|nr:serine hydrolase domain-containing protein [Vicinamibacterales bacterium]
MKRIVFLATLCAVAVAIAPAAQQRSSALDALLQAAVDQKRVPMTVAMVADGKGVVYEHAVGAPKDAIFAIASMTKPITAVAVMQLVEAGRVKLDQPAATYVKELADVQVLDGGALRAPKTPITVRQLLTHTSGFGYEFLNRDLLALVGKKQLPSVMAGGDGFLKAPLVSDPGTRWEYGISTDWLGRLVERVSGQTLDAYVTAKIADPLGMRDTFFNVPADKRARVMTIYQRGPDGVLTPQPALPGGPVEFFSGGGGLFSTAADYLTFARAILAGGQLNGRRILTESSVAAMGQNHIGNLMVRPVASVIPQLASSNGGTMPGSLDKFGLGFALNSTPTEAGRGANTLSWAGIYNTFFWIDREKQVAAVLMTQVLPFLDAGAKQVVEDFDRAVYATRSGTR